MDVYHLKHRSTELETKQRSLDIILSNLKKEKQEVDVSAQSMKCPSPETGTYYRYIHPLVEEVYFLELKQKELEEEYQNKMLSSEACYFGQQFLEASLGKAETVLKRWSKELQRLHCFQPPLSTTSAESQEQSSVHNIVYHCSYDQLRLTEDLAVTVLCQAVHVRMMVHSVLTCPNIHFFKPQKTDVILNCDTHIPGLEETVLDSLENGLSINGVISKMAAYIASDMAPFVISIPIKKRSKKKEKEANLNKVLQENYEK